MDTLRRFSFFLAFTIYTLLPSSILAEENIEISPFVGYRFGGEFEEAETEARLDIDDTRIKGLLVNVDYEANTQLEFLYSRQSSRLKSGETVAENVLFDLEIEYFHIGGTYLWPGENIRPFVASGLGLTHFNPDFSGADSTTRFSLNIGGGVKWFPNNHLGLRFDARAYGTLIDSGAAIFCGKGECRILVSGDGFIQYETNIGLVFRF